MATIRERSGKLIADFRYMGIRCRETTNLEDNAYNRRILKKRLEQLEAEITLGTFEYEKYFPKSNHGCCDYHGCSYAFQRTCINACGIVIINFKIKSY